MRCNLPAVMRAGVLGIAHKLEGQALMYALHLMQDPRLHARATGRSKPFGTAACLLLVHTTVSNTAACFHLMHSHISYSCVVIGQWLLESVDHDHTRKESNSNHHNVVP